VSGPGGRALEVTQDGGGRCVNDSGHRRGKPGALAEVRCLDGMQDQRGRHAAKRQRQADGLVEPKTV
jgi:hypothetical protein